MRQFSRLLCPLLRRLLVWTSFRLLLGASFLLPVMVRPSLFYGRRSRHMLDFLLSAPLLRVSVLCIPLFFSLPFLLDFWKRIGSEKQTQKSYGDNLS
jgi:hypothetical protein